MNQAYVSAGSNLGDRLEYIKKSLYLLQVQEGIQINRLSSFYETAPVGYLDQGKFINAVFFLETVYPPHQLLKVLQEVEFRLERERTIRWGPRTVDLDMLFYKDLVLDDAELILPHPRLTERAFVLVPLVEIAPLLRHPLTGKSASQHLDELDQGDKEGVVRLELEDRG